MTEADRRALVAMGVEVGDEEKPAPPGETIVEFVIHARAWPWRVPYVTRSGHSIKDKNLVAWQSRVKDEAFLAMGGKKPYGFGVELALTFRFQKTGEGRGKGENVPDVTNLLKALEDSLNGVVFRDDRQVSHVNVVRVLGVEDRVFVSVFATGEAFL